jgi:hypothetical protein
LDAHTSFSQVEKNRTSFSDGGEPAPEQAVAEQLKRIGAGLGLAAERWRRINRSRVNSHCVQKGTVPGSFSLVVLQLN